MTVLFLGAGVCLCFNIWYLLVMSKTVTSWKENFLYIFFSFFVRRDFSDNEVCQLQDKDNLL